MCYSSETAPKGSALWHCFSSRLNKKSILLCPTIRKHAVPHAFLKVPLSFHNLSYKSISYPIKDLNLKSLGRDFDQLWMFTGVLFTVLVLREVLKWVWSFDFRAWPFCQLFCILFSIALVSSWIEMVRSILDKKKKNNGFSLKSIGLTGQLRLLAGQLPRQMSYSCLWGVILRYEEERSTCGQMLKDGKSQEQDGCYYRRRWYLWHSAPSWELGGPGPHRGRAAIKMGRREAA